MATRDEKGFGLIEIIMAVVIVVLLGGVVYFYVQASQKKDQDKPTVTTSVSPSSSPAVSSSPTASATPVAALNNDSVKTTVTNFYDAYFKSSNSKAMDAAVAQYGTANFVSTYNGIMHGNQAVAGDPVMCVNGTVASAPTVANISLASDKATVTVKVSASVTPTVVVVNDNGLKIDSVACSS